MGDRSAEQRLRELGIELPAPPQPFGTYVEAAQAGNLLFLSGMPPTAMKQNSWGASERNSMSRLGERQRN